MFAAFLSTGTKLMRKLSFDQRRVGRPAPACKSLTTLRNEKPLGGMIQHPDPNQNPHTNPDVHSGAFPKFSDILNPVASPAPGARPHPPLDSEQPASKSSATNPERR